MMDQGSSSTPGSPRQSTERPRSASPPRPILRTHSPDRSSVSSKPSPRVVAYDFGDPEGGSDPIMHNGLLHSRASRPRVTISEQPSLLQKTEQAAGQPPAGTPERRMSVKLGILPADKSQVEGNPSVMDGLTSLLKHSLCVPLVVFVPISWALEFTLTRDKPSHDTAIFITSFFAIISLATFRAWAVGEVTLHVGPTLETLIATSFGNVVPFIVGIVALTQCNLTAVHNSLVGSILTNLLLILGMSIISAGRAEWFFAEMKFFDGPVTMSASLVFLSVIAVMIPGVFQLIRNSGWVDTAIRLRSPNSTYLAPTTSVTSSVSADLSLSRGVAVILVLTYIAQLIFQLWSHKHYVEHPPPRQAPHRIVDAIKHSVLYPFVVAGHHPFAHTPTQGHRADGGLPLSPIVRPPMLLVTGVTTSPVPSPKLQPSELQDHHTEATSPTKMEGMPEEEEEITDSPHPGRISQYGTADSTRKFSWSFKRLARLPRFDVEQGGISVTDGMLEEGTKRERKAPLWLANVVLFIVTGIVANNVRFLINSMNGLSTFTNGSLQHGWVALILLPIAGNVVDHFLTVQHASKDNLQVAISLAFAATIQMALFVIPFLCLIGWMMGKPLTLSFDPFQSVVLFLATINVIFIVGDGESNWLEGFILLSTYVIIATAFWFYPDGAVEALSCS